MEVTQNPIKTQNGSAFRQTRCVEYSYEITMNSSQLESLLSVMKKMASDFHAIKHSMFQIKPILQHKLVKQIH